MTVSGTDNLSTPHTQREFGAEPAPAADVSTEAVTRLINGMWERCERAEARAAERMLTALLARAEAAEAEVARLTAERDAALAAERAATIEAAAKACGLMAYRQRSDAARFRAGTDPRHFRLALAAVADEIALSVRALHTEATRAALEPQPITVQDAAQVPEIAAPTGSM